MNRRLKRLSRALGFAPTPPPFYLDTDAVCRRVRRTLVQGEHERSAYMKHKLKIAAVLIAAVLALAGTALAVAAQWDVLRAYFDGDPSAADGLVDREVRSVADQNYRFTVESSVSDGENAFLLVRIDALSEEGIAKLNSDDWNSMDLFNIYPLVREEDTGALGHPSSSGTSYGEVKEARTDTSRSYTVNPSLSSDDKRPAEAVYCRMGYMEKGLSIQVPLSPAESVTIDLDASGLGAPSLHNFDGGPIQVNRVTLSPFTLKIYSTNPRGDYEESPSVPLLFRYLDGTLRGFGQMVEVGGRSWGAEKDGAVTYGTLTSRFRSVMDLDELSGIVLWGKEYPLDGSGPRDVEVDPHLLPFTLPLMPALSEGIPSSVPVRALMDALGGQCRWDATTGSVRLSYRNHEVVLTPGDPVAQVDGAPVDLLAAPKLFDGMLCADASLCDVFALHSLAAFNAQQTDRVCWVISP